MIEHPNKEQRAELEQKKAELAKREFDAIFVSHEKRIDALLSKHIENPTSSSVEYDFGKTPHDVIKALSDKYKAAGWIVEPNIPAFLMAALKGGPMPAPNLLFS